MFHSCRALAKLSEAMRWAVSCIAFSGFFLREEYWRSVACHFEHFVCLDNLRDGELTLAGYLEHAVQASRKLPPPYLLVGHSFGALPARLLAQWLDPIDTRLVLLAGLVAPDGLAAVEAYQCSGQRAMSEYCRLDLVNGRIALVERHSFLERLYAPQKPTYDPALANSESLSLVLDRLPQQPLACHCQYVVCLQDQITDPDTQRKFAGVLGAECLEL